MKWLGRVLLLIVLVAVGGALTLPIWGDAAAVQPLRRQADALLERPEWYQVTSALAKLPDAASNWFQTLPNSTERGASSYRFAALERGPIRSAIAATGTINPVVTVLVGSQVSGQIAEIKVDFNDEVSRNDVLARIAPLPFELAVMHAQAELEVARSSVLIQQRTLERVKAEKENAEVMVLAAGEQMERARLVVEEARREAERRQTLLQRGAGTVADHQRSESAYQQALSQLASAEAEAEGRRAQLRSAAAQVGASEAHIMHAEAQVIQARAVLEQAQADLERTIIRAPSDGTIIMRHIEEGQTVGASFQVPTLFMIAQDLREMQVNVSVDETDIGRVEQGQPVSFTVDAFPGRVFDGKVTQIRKASYVVQNVVTYSVIVATANPDLLLLPGMTATVQIVTDLRENVLRVPETALRFRPPNTPLAGRSVGSGQVWIMGRDGEPQAVSIRVGMSDGHVAELLDGPLENGSVVVVGMDTGRTPAAPSGSGLGF